MKPIRIIDPQFNLLAEIDDYESLIYISRFHKVGEFELRINRYKRNTHTLQKGNAFILGADRGKVCYIKHREIPLDENGKQSEQILIKGYTLEGLFKNVVTVPPNLDYDSLTANAETIMKQYVTNNIISPTDTERIIGQVALAPDQSRGLSLFFQTRYKDLADELETLSLISGLGWFLTVDTVQKKWVFDVREGKNLTVNQSVNPPVTFSPEFENIKTAQYVNSDFNYKNVAYIAGQGEGADRRVVMVGNATGINRHEMFVDARDVEEVDEAGNPLPVAEIEARLTSRGLQALADRNKDIFFEAQNLTHGPFEYEKDWNLGDIVTVQNKEWGVTLDARITEVREVYQPSGFELDVVFGNSMPTLVEKIKQELSNVSTDVRR